MPLIEIRDPSDLDRLRETDAPLLVRTPRALLHQVLARLRPIDDVCLDDDPPELIAHRLGRLEDRSSPRDALTGVLTKRAALQRTAKSDWSSLILLDLDRFKRFNDLHGHAAGDALLRKVGALLLLEAPAGATVARYGGEEFAIVTELARDGAIAAAERIQQEVRGLSITISAGIGARREGLDELTWREASEALYAAKARGRDRVIHYEQLEREALENNTSRQVEHFEDVTRVITERVVDVITYRGRQLFEQIRERADVDALTGLYSRRYLEERLPKEIASDTAIIVALLDIDFFGDVNKTHGWPTGDRVLSQVADRIMGCIRAGDWVARYGGEEITIVMRQLDAEHASGVLERIRCAIAEQPFTTTSGESFTVTASIGAARRSEHEPLVSLMERVSEQLKLAKNQGRNRVRIAS